jgi:hypothetical protein
MIHRYFVVSDGRATSGQIFKVEAQVIGIIPTAGISRERLPFSLGTENDS